MSESLDKLRQNMKCTCSIELCLDLCIRNPRRWSYDIFCCHGAVCYCADVMCADEIFRMLDSHDFGDYSYLLVTTGFLFKVLEVLNICVHRQSTTSTVGMVIAKVVFEWVPCYCSLKWVYCTSHDNK